MNVIEKLEALLNGAAGYRATAEKATADLTAANTRIAALEKEVADAKAAQAEADKAKSEAEAQVKTIEAKLAQAQTDADQAKAKADAEAKAKVDASLASQGVASTSIPKVDPGAAKSLWEQYADLRAKDPAAAGEFYMKHRSEIVPK